MTAALSATSHRWRVTFLALKILSAASISYSSIALQHHCYHAVALSKVMRVVEKSSSKVVITSRWRGGLACIAGSLLLAGLFLALDSKHPKARLLCTRHPVLSGGKQPRSEDIDCTLEVRPPRTALDLTFHEEVDFSFELSGVHLERLHPLISCRLTCVQSGNNTGCHCEHDTAVAVAPAADADTHAQPMLTTGSAQLKAQAAAAAAAAEQGKLTLVLEDNEGSGHVYYAFSRTTEAEAAYATVDAFLKRAHGISTAAAAAAAATAADDDTSAQLVLSVEHDSSWLDEAAGALFALLALWLMLQPMFERVTFDAGAGVSS
jgi:hypothetical protein